MKPLVAKSATCALAAGVWLVASVGTVHAQPDSSAPDKATAAASASPAASPGKTRTDKKLKGTPRADKSAPTARVKTPKPIDFPLPQGESALGLTIPETDLTGQLVSQLMAAKATRVDDEHVQMTEMKIDLNHPDGKEDFHILLPTSVFNLKTRIITSKDMVTVRTQDFELTGEGMEFNTIDRTGKMLGNVRMLVHNLKQVAGQGTPPPTKE